MFSSQSSPRSMSSSSAAPRRVLLYSGSYNHITDGVTLTLNRLVKYLEAQGTEVLVVAPTTQEPELEHAGSLLPVPSVALPGRGEYRMATIIPPNVRAQISRFKPNIVHVATPDLLGRWVMSYARRKGIPVVTTYHTDFLSYLRYYNMDCLQSFLLSYLRYFYRRCDLICVPSQSMIEELESRGLEGSMRIWARGVEANRFNTQFRSVQWRRSHGVPDGVPIINYTGRLVWEKNVRYLVDLTEGLKKRQIPHRLLIVGDGPAREELEGLLPDGIFAGHLGGEQLSRAYASSDIFFFPSTTETFGNVVLEAMASGLPSVCAEATGSRDLVQHQSTGYLAPGEAVEQLVHYIAKLATDSTLRQQMSQNSLERAQRYRWEAILQSMLHYYAEAERLSTEIPKLRRALALGPRRTG